MEHKVCLVTGASRGAGRGIAVALGETGATVYVTGRTLRPAQSVDGLSGTIQETADLVSQRGGKGIAVQCDHGNEVDVRNLVLRIERDHGRLDLLVNNAWGGYESYDAASFGARFWEADAELWDRDRYLHALVYDVAKTAVNRMAFGMAQELRPFGIAVIALAPGWMRTERVMQAHEETPMDLSTTESPEYVGRIIAALMADPDIMSKTGETFRGGDLAPDYGVRDIDGSQPPGFGIPLYSADNPA